MYSLSLHDTARGSLLCGLYNPENITGCLCDYHSLSATVSYFKSAKDKFKPILGCQFFTDSGFITLIAKNKNGYHNLIRILSRSHDPDLYNNGPKVTLDLVENYSKDLICLTGGLNSQLAYNICKYDEVYYEPDINRVKSLLHIDTSIIERYKSIFGEDLILEKYENKNYPFTEILSSINQDLSAKYKITIENIGYDHGLDNHIDLLTILAIGLRCKLSNLHDVLKEKQLGFLIPQLDNIKYPDPKFFERCENYSIFEGSNLPKYPWTNGLSEIEYLKSICREGWVRKNKKWGTEYSDRIKMELAVIEKANLSGYFLIVSDYIKWAKNNNILVNTGRGSVAGSLVAYLMDITEVDPIPYNLIFSRFYNEGRNKPGSIELPDIDTDFPSADRDKVISYVRNKYGSDKVAHISTYGRMMGASILKEVFSIHKACTPSEANFITKLLPPESKIAGDLEEMEKEEEIYSIIKWKLENEPHDLLEYAKIEKDEIVGPLSHYFKQAIRLEGHIKTQGTHAAGVVISNDPLSDHCPMIHNKNGDDKIIGYDMESLKKINFTKFDFLVLATLDKIQDIMRDL